MALAAQKGESLSLKGAYEKACKLNSDVQDVISLRKGQETAQKNAKEARRKKRASKSLKGKSSGSSRRRSAEVGNVKDDMRADIEAAMAEGEG